MAVREEEAWCLGEPSIEVAMESGWPSQLWLAGEQSLGEQSLGEQSLGARWWLGARWL